MKNEKNYCVCVTFGNGRPLDTKVIARNGFEAIEKAKSLHPGSRIVHLLGVDEVKRPVFIPTETYTVTPRPSAQYVKQRQIEMCLEMKAQGKSQRTIASHLGLSKTTVSSWLHKYG